MHTEFWLESLKGRDHFEGLSIYGRTISKCIFGERGLDWIHLAQNRDWWQALVKMVINLWVP
jgi:hypothetical protein